MKRLAAAVLTVSALAVLSSTSSASAASVCVYADVDVNGTAQSIEQCLPE